MNDNALPAGLIEPDPREIVLCVYEPTLDGFAAAWVVRTVFKEAQIPVEFAYQPIGDIDATGRNVLYLGDQHQPVTGAARSVVQFDNDGETSFGAPLPFKDWERVFPYGVKTLTKAPAKVGVVTKKNSSLVGLAWDFFHANKIGLKRPFVVDQIDDHVAGTKKFRDSADIYACADTYPQDFMTFDRLAEACEDRKRLDFVIAGGQAVNRFLAKHAGKALRIEAVS